MINLVLASNCWIEGSEDTQQQYEVTIVLMEMSD